jgi:hypothetical protein
MKKFIAIGILALMVMAAIPAAFAAATPKTGFGVQLTSKDIVTGKPIIGKYQAHIIGATERIIQSKSPIAFIEQRVYAYLFAKPNTDYKIAITTALDNNSAADLVCIGQLRTRYNGAGTARFLYQFSGLINDIVVQRLWIVPSSDIDCTAGKITAWDPGQILFGVKAI